MELSISSFLESSDVMFSKTLLINESDIEIADLKLSYPIKLELTLYKVNEDLDYTLQGNVKLLAACDRCLREIEQELNLNASGRTSIKGIADKNLDSNDISIIDNEYINIDELVWTQLFSSLPMKILCSEECKGLCQACGQDLNDKACRCETNTGDLRFEKLRELFSNE